MKSTKAENGVASLNGFTSICEFYGLQYFSLKSNLKENFKNSISIYRKIYFSVLFLMSIFVSVLSIMTTTPEQGLTKKNVLVELYQQSINYFYFVSVLSSYLQALKSTANTQKMFKNLKEVAESSFCHFGVAMNFKTFTRSVWRRFSVTVAIFVSFQTTMFSTHVRGPLSSMLLANIMPAFFESFLLMVANKFIFYVSLVNFQLECIHELLKKVSANQIDCFVLNASSMKVIKVYSKIHDQRLLELQEIWEIYRKVCDNGALVNKCVGISILSIMVNLVLGLTHSGYELSVTLLGGTSSLPYIGWFLFRGLKSFCIKKSKFTDHVYACSITSAIFFQIFKLCHKTSKLVSIFYF